MREYAAKQSARRRSRTVVQALVAVVLAAAVSRTPDIALAALGLQGACAPGCDDTPDDADERPSCPPMCRTGACARLMLCTAPAGEVLATPWAPRRELAPSELGVISGGAVRDVFHPPKT